MLPMVNQKDDTISLQSNSRRAEALLGNPISLSKESLYLQGARDVILRLKDDYAMYTAIYSNKYLIPLLFEEGYGDVALKVLFNRSKPSFGTMLDGDATTIWEVPDMQKVAPENEKISSYNHPMQ